MSGLRVDGMRRMPDQHVRGRDNMAKTVHKNKQRKMLRTLSTFGHLYAGTVSFVATTPLLHPKQARDIVKNVIQNINTNMYVLILSLLLLALPQQVLAIQDIPIDVRQIDISTERHSYNSVIDTAQDADGHLWFASVRGLHVYDGNVVRPVLADILQGTKIRDIHIDGNDVLWVATNSGILAYSLKNQTPRWHRTNGSTKGLASNTVHVLHEDQRGTLWAGTTENGLHRYEPSFDTFKRVDVVPSVSEKKSNILDIRADVHRDMWLGTDQGLLQLTGNQGPATPIPLSTGEPYSAKKIAFDADGNLWVAVATKGLWILPKNAPKNELIQAHDLPAKNILDLYTDSAGDVWICTTQGLFRYAFREAQIYVHPFLVSNPQNKTPVNIASITETSSKTLWIGTFNHGVLHRSGYPGAKLIALETKGGVREFRDANVICAVSPKDSSIYIAPRSGGLYRSAPVDVNRMLLSSRLEIEQLLETPRLQSLAWDADNALLCGTVNASLLRIDAKLDVERVQVISNPKTVFTDRDIIRTVPMDDGRIWFASKFELYSWRPGEATARKEQTDSFKPSISSMTRREAQLWIGHGSAVTVLDTQTGNSNLLPLPAQTWAENATVKTLFVDDYENLWIGTTKNIFRYNLKSKALVPIYATGQVPVPNALSFWLDPAGSIWLHTQDRIFEIPAKSDRAVERAIGAAHPSANISSSPAALSHDMLAYGHSDGLLLISPPRLVSQPHTVPKISEIRIFGQPIPPTQLGRMPENLELEHDKNYLTFIFSIPELNASRLPHFFYMLEGIDTTWNDTDKRDSVSYAHLSPGRYTLHLKDGFDGAITTSMGINILPPLWLTLWAIAGYALAIVLTILTASRMFARVQTTRIRKEMLENLVMLDPLTGVPNRRKFKEVLIAEKSRCKRSNHQISVLMIDIDYFKGFNDRLGHQAGDAALRTVAQTLSATLRRPEDFVARYGGEEFVVVLPSTSRAGAERVAKKIQEAIRVANIPYPGSPLSDRITLSLGISTFSPQSDLHIDSGLFSADQALYQAKRNGRNCFFYKDHCLALTPLRQ